MFEELMSALICLTIILLIALYFNYEDPTQMDDETDDEFNKRKKDYDCNFDGRRNFLLMTLGISMVSCLYELCTKDAKFTGGGLIEDMGPDEENLYIGDRDVKGANEVYDNDLASNISDND